MGVIWRLWNYTQVLNATGINVFPDSLKVLISLDNVKTHYLKPLHLEYASSL